ncbi:MAG: phosphoenolpyruvate carboxykinase, partial [Oscillospiraceae bacterium]|nr:phosphoenolpyruvate carboxykinase [Oscillospiraceae bacterium]
MTKNPNVNQWVDEMIALCKPDQVIWIDGSKAQLDQLVAEVTALPDGHPDKLYPLNQDLYPGCLYHRTRPNDVARVEDRTFICSRRKEDAGPTNNWMDPKEMYAKLTPLYDGVMKGRTMYVIPYSMGPIG